MEWVSDSNQKDACFIVVNSQNESQFSQAYGTPAKRLGKLTALSSDQKCKPGRRENITERHPFSPRNVLSSDMYTTRGRCVKALTASNGNGEPVNQPATGDQQPSGDHHNNNSNHGDGDPAHEGGAVGGAGGGGGGGDGGGGDHNDNDNADDDGSPHEEEPIEETPPSTSSSSGNSVPQLVRPSASPQSPSIHYPEHSVPHLEHPEMLGEREAVAGTSGAAAAYVAESDSDEEGGAPHSAPPVPADVSANVLETSESESVISEATTAVVSDTERYGHFIGERSASSHPSPAPSLSSIASQATQEAPPAELSSAVSTLSSLTSSSSGSEQQPSFRPPKRRLPARRGHTKIKRSRLDTSSTSTSTTDSTTTTATTTTTSDTSPERSRHQFGDRSRDPSTGHSPGPSGDHTRDTSGGQRRDGVGRSHDAPCDQLPDKSGLSQQDMFAEDTPVTESSVGEMLPPDSAPHVHRTTPGDVLEWSHRKRPVGSQTHANSLDPPEDHARSQDHTNQLAAISQDQLTRPRSQDQWTRSQEVTSDGQIKLDGQLAEEQHIPLTPSETLSSLHLSGQPMVVMETLEDDDDDGEPSYVPPSQEACGLVPSIIPASSTAEIPSSREDEDAGMFHSHQREENSNVGGCRGNKGDGGSSGSSKDSSRQGSASMSFQQWQPSFLSSQESVSRSSASLTQGCGRGTDKEGGGDNLVSAQDHDPEDHQGHVSQQRGLVDYSGGSSQDLVLHFTQTQGGCSSRPLTKGSQVVSRSETFSAANQIAGGT
ncbi:hypothetical protein LSAT2_030997 [Lamellibrachia satsuma]|nr:hypothetical protein LSAT2_030997 [Lamellibrachia satsuma]